MSRASAWARVRAAPEAAAARDACLIGRRLKQAAAEPIPCFTNSPPSPHRRSGSLGRQGSAPGGKPPTGPAPRKAASGSLGGLPASAVPSPLPSLARRASLPHRAGSSASAGSAGGGGGAHLPAGWHRRDSAQSVGTGTIAEEEAQDSPAGEPSNDGSSWAAVVGRKALRRSASLDAPCPAAEPAAPGGAQRHQVWEAGEAQQGQPASAPAPADKLEKAEVLRWVC